MERNTILAIILSFIVLFSYESIFPPTKPKELVNNSQAITSQNVTSQNLESTVVPAESVERTTSNEIKAIKYNIGTTQSKFIYTNVGGLLHKVDFLNNNPFPITDILNVSGLENAQYTGQELDDKTVEFLYKDKNWQITKTYEIKDKNLINVRMEIKNISGISILNNYSFTTFEISEPSQNANQNFREIALYEYSVYAKNHIFRKGNANNFYSLTFFQRIISFIDGLSGNTPQFNNYNKKEDAAVNWVAFRDRYHAFIVKPEFETKSYEIKAESNNQLKISISPQDKNLAPGESIRYDFNIYAGPQNPWLMKKYGQGFEKIIAFSNFAIIELIGQAIYHALPFFHGIFKSWGAAIILVSVILYGLTYPLTMKSMISMRKMQEVQPKMTALRERYKDDPQKLNQEMMEIYRREKINPFGGCLPMLIQMPFFMALYQILWRAQYLQGQHFLWIKDLSQPDRLIIFPFYLPFFGNELNILPILTGSLMFVQQKISSKNIVVTDEQQAMQQKMMMYILPVMMTCMFYKFASSWAVYFLVFYIFSTITQLKIAKLAGKK